MAWLPLASVGARLGAGQILAPNQAAIRFAILPGLRVTMPEFAFIRRS